jgi:cysteinyl-tRNA synthetase
MRAVILADFINRSFQYLNYEVNFVRNYTDVGHMTSDGDDGEDKMETRAKIEKKTPKEIADFYIKNYEIDTKKLNILEPQKKPRATEFISEQIEMIEKLLEKDFAYITTLAIYFDTCKAENYHRLSGQKFEENICGAGSGKISDSDKKNNSDFAL